MFLQAQGVPRRCNSGLAQQNGTKGGGVMIEVYIDGSSKGNPGPGGAGIVIQDKATQETLGIHGIPLGHVTNNQAEFLALKHALIELKTQGLSHRSRQHPHRLPARRRDLLPELEGQGEPGAGDGDQGSTQGVSAANFCLRQGAQREPGQRARRFSGAGSG